MKAELRIQDSIPVVALAGRLDGAGAARLEAQVATLDRAVARIVLDVAEVDYLSSAGIRTLLVLEKRLRAAGGGVLVAGLTPFVSEVLATAGLLGQLKALPTVAEAVALASSLGRAEAGSRRTEIDGRSYAVRSFEGAEATLTLWGSLRTPLPAGDPARLAAADLAELGFCFGVGGFGNNRGQAAEALGEFVSIGGAAGVVPTDASPVADFLVKGAGPSTTMYVQGALGLSGAPAAVLDVTARTPFRLDQAVADAFRILAPGGAAAPPVPVLGFVALATADELHGAHYRTPGDLASDRHADRAIDRGSCVLIVGVAARQGELGEGADPGLRQVLAELPVGEPGAPFRLHCHGLVVDPVAPRALAAGPAEDLAGLRSVDGLRDVAHLRGTSTLRAARLWLYAPRTLASPAQQRLAIEHKMGPAFREEWEVIVRRLYADSSRVVLDQLHGGFTATTFRAASYDPDGRRMCPTVFKVGGLAVMKSEEEAYRKYVANYILNNSPIIMGTASHGGWEGLRYNFLGVNGPDSALTWLRDALVERPVEELLPLFDRLFTEVLKPWYGQPKWEIIRPYADQVFDIFPDLPDKAREVLGISPDDETLPCPELGITLPNPYHFLRHQYPLRRTRSCSWYTGINHGDLNTQNVLLDEKQNLYVIDFSFTRPRNIVCDFARLEPILKFELTDIRNAEDLQHLLEFEQGLAQAGRIDEAPPLVYRGRDPMVRKAHALICRLRSYADTVTLFETDLVPYLIALLEWTLPAVFFAQLGPLAKRYAAYSAGFLVKRLLELERK